jgi:ABC-2 type transport system permease protein
MELEKTGLDVYSDSKQYIQNVRNLHEYITGHQKVVESQRKTDSSNKQMIIAYRLDNGSLFVREYNLPVHLFKEQLKPVLESESYKQNLPELSQLRNDILTIRITPSGPISDAVTITDAKEIEELKALIKKELLSQTLDDLTSTINPWGYIEFTYEHADQIQEFEGYSIDWKKSYSEITKWLDDHNYLDKARIDAEDIVKAEVTKVNTQELIDVPIPDEIFHQGEEVFTITDKDLLEKTLQVFTEYPENHTYYIKYSLKDGTEWYGSISDENILNEIRDLFK